MTPEQIRKQTAELVGTFFLCFIGAGAILADARTNGSLGLLGIALAYGLALSIAVSATMNISGGHINPAVTITMWFFKNISGKDAIGYIISQLLGGLIAGFCLLVIYRAMGANALIEDAPYLGTPALGENVSPLLGVFIEAIVTFLLLFAIFGTAVDPRAPKIGGFGIGLTVAFDIMMAGPLTGAAMNPARTFATAVPAGFFEAHWVYWVGPIIGGILAGLVYTTVILPGAHEEAS